jgi:hypothetical protein
MAFRSIALHVVFEWHPEQGEDYKVVCSSPLDAWLKGKALYEESALGG